MAQQQNKFEVLLNSSGSDYLYLQDLADSEHDQGIIPLPAEPPAKPPANSAYSIANLI